MTVVRITDDGSPTLINSITGITYHSVFGAKGESEYVFIHQSELENKLNIQNQVNITEIGLGTGLNAWLTYKLVQKYPYTKVCYTSYEIYPLSREILIEYYSLLGDLSFVEILADFPKNVLLSNFQTNFQYVSWLEAPLHKNTADIIFYDAFAPKVCPELWTEQAIQKALDTLKPGGIMTTFSVTGALKRILKNMPVQIFTPKGFGKKREMLKVIKL